MLYVDWAPTPPMADAVTSCYLRYPRLPAQRVSEQTDLWKGYMQSCFEQTEQPKAAPWAVEVRCWTGHERAGLWRSERILAWHLQALALAES